MYDKDGSGSIELDEMVEVMSALQGNTPQAIEVARSRGQRLFSELDINGDGNISCEEFVRGCMQDPELVRLISTGGLNPLEDDDDF